MYYVYIIFIYFYLFIGENSNKYNSPFLCFSDILCAYIH